MQPPQQNNHPDSNKAVVAPIPKQPCVLREEWVHRGKWLGLKHMHWADSNGVERVRLYNFYLLIIINKNPARILVGCIC